MASIGKQQALTELYHWDSEIFYVNCLTMPFISITYSYFYHTFCYRAFLLLTPMFVVWYGFEDENEDLPQTEPGL